MNQKGFTLVELTIVVVIVAVLFIAVMILLDPLRLFAESRNARRWHDVNNISTAIYRHIVQTSEIPEGIKGKEQQIGTALDGCDIACPSAEKTCFDLLPQLKPYLIEIPHDPRRGTTERTQYSIKINEDNVIIVSACQPERGAEIYLAR